MMDQTQDYYDREYLGTLLSGRWPRPGAKLRYKGTHPFHATNLIANAERELRLGDIYTLKMIRLGSSTCIITLEESGDAEYELAFFDRLFSIAFVCTANLCRSVMAHAIAVPELASRGWPVAVFSAGTMDCSATPTAIPTWLTCCQNNTPPQKDVSTFVRELPMSSIYRFFVMERQHHECLVTHYGVSPERISFLGSFDPKRRGDEIEDPMNQGSVVFDRCYTLIRDCIIHYLDTTTEIPATPPALQRTGAAVTLAASGLRLAPAMQPARQPPPSLSLGSLGVASASR